MIFIYIEYILLFSECWPFGSLSNQGTRYSGLQPILGTDTLFKSHTKTPTSTPILHHHPPPPPPSHTHILLIISEWSLMYLLYLDLNISNTCKACLYFIGYLYWLTFTAVLIAGRERLLAVDVQYSIIVPAR